MTLLKIQIAMVKYWPILTVAVPGWAFMFLSNKICEGKFFCWSPEYRLFGIGPFVITGYDL